LDGVTPFEQTSRGMKAAKVILGLSFFLPYLADWLYEGEFNQFIIYAPTWVAAASDWSSFIGPTPMALILFFYWFPYVLVGYLSYRFAQGRYSSIRWYVVQVVIVTIFAVLMILPMTTFPRASSGGMVYYSTTLPLPLVSILAIAMIPILRPVELTSPWDDVNKDVFSQSETTDTAQDTAPKK
jgi:hypothetical protein